MVLDKQDSCCFLLGVLQRALCRGFCFLRLGPGDCSCALLAGFPFLTRSFLVPLQPHCLAFGHRDLWGPVGTSSQPVVMLLVCLDSGVEVCAVLDEMLSVSVSSRPQRGRDPGSLQSDSRDPGWFLRKPVLPGPSHPFNPKVDDAGCHQPVQTVGGTRKDEGRRKSGSVIDIDVYFLLAQLIGVYRPKPGLFPGSSSLNLGRKVLEPVSLISQKESDSPGM